MELELALDVLLLDCANTGKMTRTVTLVNKSSHEPSTTSSLFAHQDSYQYLHFFLGFPSFALLTSTLLYVHFIELIHLNDLLQDITFLLSILDKNLGELTDKQTGLYIDLLGN